VNCPKCGEKTTVTHVYKAGSTTKTAVRECGKCQVRYTSVTMLVGESTRRGLGAAALATSLRQGKKVVRIDEPET